MRIFLLSAQHLRKLKNGDDGQALVLVCLGLMMVLMMAGLGVDVGYLRYQKQQMQKAADAGAIAAATVIGYNGTDYILVARNEVAANGFTNGVNNISVDVNNPPAAGDPFAGNSNYVQVIVTQPRPTFFMQVIRGLSPVSVSSRSVASAIGNSSGCIYVLDRATDSGTLLMDGNVNLSTTCGIYIDSNSNSALLKHGNSGAINVDATGIGIGIVGGYSGSGISPTPVTGIPPFKDPLETLQAPTFDPNHCDFPQQNFTGGSHPLVHGNYCGGIHASGNATVTFGPGTYVLIGGGLTIGGTAQMSGTGVMFYNTRNGTTYPYGPISMGGNSTTQLSAPMTGIYAGILFFQDRSIPVGSASSSFDGSTGAAFTGALYFPTTNVQFKGTPNVSSYSPIVAYQLEFKGDATIKDDFLPNDGSPIRSAQLVE